MYQRSISILLGAMLQFDEKGLELKENFSFNNALFMKKRTVVIHYVDDEQNVFRFGKV